MFIVLVYFERIYRQGRTLHLLLWGCLHAIALIALAAAEEPVCTVHVGCRLRSSARIGTAPFAFGAFCRWSMPWAENAG